MIKHIPNALTSFNLLFGCLSVIAALKGELTLASTYIGLAAVLDYFDGFVARALKAYSELGKQLDSLADMVSFGVAPGMIFYFLAKEHTSYHPLIQLIPLLIPVFSAIRLAKFNIDTRQSDSFIGVPTPANAIFIASIPFILAENSFGLTSFLLHPYFLLLFPFLSAYSLVSPLPLLALKFKHFNWKQNEFRYGLIIVSLLSILLFQFAGVALSIILYILISIIQQIINTTHD